jgi:hypothetical protein
MVRKSLGIFLLVPCLLLIAGIVTAAPLWQLHVGDWSTFTKTDSLSNTWTVTANVTGTQTFEVGGINKEYFVIRQTNYDNDGHFVDMYMRSEGNNGYMYNGTGEDLFAQAADVGTTWNYPCYEEGYGIGTRYLEIIAIEPVTVPYGTFLTAYVVRAREVFAGYTSPYVYNYFVPGFGMVKEVDYWADNAPTTAEITTLHTTNSIIWHNSITGDYAVWYMDGVTRTGGAAIVTVDPSTNWSILGTADFNSDGKPDIIWHNSITGDYAVWYMDGVTRTGGAAIVTVDPSTNWTILGQ